MLTPDGAAALAQAVATWLADATLQITDGSASANAVLLEAPRVEGTEVVLVAEFPEDMANFEWKVRRVVVGGQVVDEETVDLGRKAQGVWTLEAIIDTAP